MADQLWVPDVLPGFEQLTLPLPDDDEGEVVATLVRPVDPAALVGRPDRPLRDAGVDLLYVHGWCDYFFQTHLAQFWERLGVRFHALDLRKYGRSLREWQTPGYVDTLRTYSEDIEAALAAMGHGVDPADVENDELDDAADAEPETDESRLDEARRKLFELPVAALSRLSIGTGLGLSAGLAQSLLGHTGHPLGDGEPAAETTPRPSARHSTNSVGRTRRALTASTDASPSGNGATDSHDAEGRLAGRAASGPGASSGRKNERKLVLLGHSTGGLTLPLWLAHNPGRADALILNSPWLEFQIGSAGRRALEGPIHAQAALAPKSHLANVDQGFYARSISNRHEGEWDIDPNWRPDDGWGFPSGWLSAIFRGQERIARGLDIDVPILVQMSARSTSPVRWHPEMMRADAVLNVTAVAQRAPLLGRLVTTARFDGALHDVTLSAAPVRQQLWKETRRWFHAYVR